MTVGWSKTDEATADEFRSIEVGDKISVNFLKQPLTVEDTRTTDTGNCQIKARTNRDGYHRLTLWQDADVDNRPEWYWALFNERWRDRKERWQNNSDVFTNVYAVETADTYEVNAEAYGGVKINKNSADSLDEAFDIARGKTSSQWTIIDDANAGEEYVNEHEDYYSVTLLAVTTKQIKSLDDPRPIKLNPGSAFHDVAVIELVNIDTGETLEVDVS